MIVKILDTVTMLTRQDVRFDAQYWAEGEGSTDKGRGGDKEVCERFLIVQAASGPLAKLNAKYPEELFHRFCGNGEMPPHMYRRLRRKLDETMAGLVIPSEVKALIPFVIPEIGYGTHGTRGWGDTWCQRGSDGIYEVRQGFTMMGAEPLCPYLGPFDEEFHDNYFSGRATTIEKALEIMLIDAWKIGESVWAC